MQTPITSGLALLILLPSALLLAQGSLTPPGAPAPVMKTLHQLEPRTDLATVAGDAANEHVISQPGSYFLSKPVTTAKSFAISVTAADVTLDLNGFHITRSGGSGGNAILIGTTAHRLTISNGSVIGNFGTGIGGAVGSKGTRIEDVSVSGSTTTAILVREGAVVRGCRVADLAGSGIQAGPSATVSHCTVSNSQSGRGIFGLFGTLIEHCAVRQQTGFSGLEVQSSGVITGCSVIDSTATLAAIRGDFGTNLSHSTAFNNVTPVGITVASGSTISHCTARGNTSAASSSTGISADGQSTIFHCTAAAQRTTFATPSAATGAGFAIANGSTIQNCTAGQNQGDGIRVGPPGFCVVRHNQCQGNGAVGGDGAGIHVLATMPGLPGLYSSLDSNVTTENDRGIDVDETLNFIIRNTAGNNGSNYEIVAGNRVGVIGAAPVSAAVSGGTGGAGVGTTDPWANISF